MAFETVQIQTTKNGASSVVGARDDLASGDVVSATLTSNLGVSSVRWELVGRPEYSTAGGGGAAPWVLAPAALSASFAVDADLVSGTVHLDGTYVLHAVINPGSAGQVTKTVILARNSGLTIPGITTARPLRK